jgi:hypothetical protein
MAAHVDLFSRDLPEACAAYRRMYALESDRVRRMREHCERLWNVFHPYADAQFADEFPLHGAATPYRSKASRNPKPLRPCSWVLTLKYPIAACIMVSSRMEGSRYQPQVGGIPVVE